MAYEFEWDEEKAQKNLDHHGVSFLEAVVAFSDPHAVEIEDYEHSTDEEIRYALIGLATPGLLYVVYTVTADNNFRLIHARIADPRMVKLYENKKR